MKRLINFLLILSTVFIASCSFFVPDDGLGPGEITDKRVDVRMVKYHPTLSEKPRYTYWLEIDGVWQMVGEDTYKKYKIGDYIY